MKKTLLTGVAALFLETGTAHAAMCSNYLCGKVEVHSCLVKPSYNDNKFWSIQTTINIPINTQDDNIQDDNYEAPNSGVFVGGLDTGRATYYLKGKRYKCERVPTP